MLHHIYSIFILSLEAPVLTSVIAADGSHISPELGRADIAEVESKESLPGADVQRVVFLAEVQSGEVKDSAG